MKEKKLAIFDVDGTIFRSSLLIKLVDELIAEKLFKPGVENGYLKLREEWLDREGSYEAYINAVIRVFDQNLRGLKYTDLRKIAHRVVVREKSHTYIFTRDLVKKLKHKGYFILAISHSPKLAVENFCKALGFSKVYGIMNELDASGRFTGRALHQDVIFDKAKVLERALSKGGLTLKGSVGVGDTESDIAFLKMVSRPIAFNPNKKLYTYAKKKGWEIVVERKDVIYKV
jgi:HAD superfamily hydrolase (TIGR01490 family)